MSVQFGNWNFQGCSSNSFGLGPVREHLAPYGRDGVCLFHDENVDILFCCMRETDDAEGKEQPFRIGSHQVLTWDGRLDNRADLVRELAGIVTTSDTDVAIVPPLTSAGASRAFQNSSAIGHCLFGIPQRNSSCSRKTFSERARSSISPTGHARSGAPFSIRWCCLPDADSR